MAKRTSRKRRSKKRSSKRSSKRRLKFYVVVDGIQVGSASTLPAARSLARRLRNSFWIDRGDDSWEV